MSFTKNWLFLPQSFHFYATVSPQQYNILVQKSVWIFAKPKPIQKPFMCSKQTESFYSLLCAAVQLTLTKKIRQRVTFVKRKQTSTFLSLQQTRTRFKGQLSERNPSNKHRTEWRGASQALLVPQHCQLSFLAEQYIFNFQIKGFWTKKKQHCNVLLIYDLILHV